MEREFLERTTPAVRVGVLGFVVAVVGVALAFLGVHVSEKWLGIVGYSITVVGVSVGFGGVIYGWVKDGRRAVVDGLTGVFKIREKYRAWRNARRST